MTHRVIMNQLNKLRFVFTLIVISQIVIASDRVSSTPSDESIFSMHPPVKLLDSAGTNVLVSGEAVSTRKSCGECHDYDFIAQGYHSQQGRLEMRDWKNRSFPYFGSRGMYGKWCSMPNRQLTPLDYEHIEDFDLGTPEWIQSCGVCHIGGGITEFDRRDRRYPDVPLDEIAKDDPDYHYFSVKKGKLVQWDWQESGVAEVDCFLCHIKNFDRPSRDEQIKGGYFQWAATATLKKTGIVEDDFGLLVYNEAAFNEDGSVKPEYLALNEPAPENCGQCHGFVGLKDKKNTINPYFSNDLLRGTKKFGRVWSSGKIKDSNVNLPGKETMDFSWDIHAEKDLKCIDCHFSVNNPARKIRDTREADHLIYHPVDVELKEFLHKPDHNFAKGHSYPESIREEHECTMRSCRECHAPERKHDWLPYKEHHFKKIGCETCHVPRKNYWAYKQLDMTLSPKPASKVRGLAPGGSPEDLTSEVTGFQPAYFPRTCKDMIPRITPHNLITSLFWFDTEKKRPAFKRQLIDAFMEYDDLYKLKYTAETLAVFDSNNDQQLTESEKRIDSPEKYQFARKRMIAAGVADAELHLEILPFSLAHNIVSKEQAIKTCTECHSSKSRLLEPFEVFDFVPLNTEIHVAPVVDVNPTSHEYQSNRGTIDYLSQSYLGDYYIFGKSRITWLDTLGWLTVATAISGSTIHGLLRLFPGIFLVFKRKKGNNHE